MKEKPIINSLKLALVLFVFFSIASCSEEIVLIEEKDRTELDSIETQINVTTEDLTAAKTEKNALQRRLDSLTDVLSTANVPTGLNADVHYTVQVTDGSQGYITGRTTSVSNAIVTVIQGNTSVEITTDNTGLATFPALESGFISVTVEISGFSDLYMIVDLRDGGIDSNGTNADTRYASTQAMVFPTLGASAFTITGKSYFNPDLDDDLRDGTQNNPFHPFTGAEVWDPVAAGRSFIVDCLPSSIPLNTLRSGRIISIVYAGLSRVATSDANGNWSITLPVVLLDNGSNFFSYTGPNLGDTFSGTQTSTLLGDTDEIWYPSTFYPNPLNEILLFPGGNSTQDLYYFTL